MNSLLAKFSRFNVRSRRLWAATLLAVAFGAVAPSAHAVWNPKLSGTYKISGETIKVNKITQLPPPPYNNVLTFGVGSRGFQGTTRAKLANEFKKVIAAANLGTNVQLFVTPGPIVVNSVSFLVAPNSSVSGNFNAQILSGSASATIKAKSLTFSLSFVTKNKIGQPQNISISIKLKHFQSYPLPKA